jgi:hypothetical protein
MPSRTAYFDNVAVRLHRPFDVITSGAGNKARGRHDNRRTAMQQQRSTRMCIGWRDAHSMHRNRFGCDHQCMTLVTPLDGMEDADQAAAGNRGTTPAASASK